MAQLKARGKMQSSRRVGLPAPALFERAREGDARSRSLHRHWPISPHHRTSRMPTGKPWNRRPASEALVHRPARVHSHRERSANAHRPGLLGFFETFRRLQSPLRFLHHPEASGKRPLPHRRIPGRRSPRKWPSAECANSISSPRI